jgi:hypothetical protein
MKGKHFIASAVIGWLIAFQFASNATELTKYQFDKTINGQKISVMLEIGPFDAKRHSVKHLSLEDGYLIDGQKPIGNDGDTEAVPEFKRLEVYWNDKKVPLGRECYSAIFNVPLHVIVPRTDPRPGFTITPSVDGSSVLMYFRPNVGDGESDEAWLVISRTGEWKKFRDWAADPN